MEGETLGDRVKAARAARAGMVDTGPGRHAATESRNRESEAKKKSKHRPREEPISGRPSSYVGRPKELESRSRRGADPRFEEHCGKFNENLFEKTYAFVDEMREKELNSLRDKLKKEKKLPARKELLQQVHQTENQLAQIASDKRRKEIKRNFKREEREKVKEGKKPYYLTDRKLKDLELRAKYEELKKSGKLKKYIEKRRKRQASKDKKLLLKTS
mmetsp:Transcript_6537/g.19831  ORF Transcript_6537/g.19831 Transcript_6537/m.19831 type:complete len:216 (-) Transcript_6537:331-978(-)